MAPVQSKISFIGINTDAQACLVSKSNPLPLNEIKTFQDPVSQNQSCFAALQDQSNIQLKSHYTGCFYQDKIKIRGKIS